jgi:hypothetical protein
MASNIKLGITVIFVPVVLGLILLGAAGSCLAQVSAAQSNTTLLATNDSTSAALPYPGSVEDSSTSDPQAPSSKSAQSKSSSDDSGWHIAMSPYLWFPGVHGTTGKNGHNLSIHASPGDLLSNFRFGLMGAVEVRRKRLLLNTDLMWVRLEDDKPLLAPGDIGIVTTANIKGDEFLLTPKIGYRLIDEEKIKIDALTGFRYWHVGTSLNFNPSALGLSFSKSYNWVDPLVGGRIQFGLAPKVVVNILGDVGGWGTGSQLDYQFAGLLGYKIKPNVTLQAGYRYMGIDYRNSGFLFNVITSGAILGATINLK